MKTIIYAILMAITFSLQAQNERSETLFTTIYLQPEFGKEGQFRQGLKAHNEKFHSKAPHQTTVFIVQNGPRAGQYMWLLGPHTYADKDLVHAEGHGPDWGQNVSANSSGFGPREIWKLQTDYVKNGETNHPISRVRYLEINTEERQGYRMFGLFEQLAKALNAMGGDFNWAVYENEFQQGKQGRHFAIVSDYPDWETVGKVTNRDNKAFRETFDKVNGQGAYEKHRKEWREVFVDTYDEYLVRQEGL